MSATRTCFFFFLKSTLSVAKFVPQRIDQLELQTHKLFSKRRHLQKVNILIFRRTEMFISDLCERRPNLDTADVII